MSRTDLKLDPLSKVHSGEAVVGAVVPMEINFNGNKVGADLHLRTPGISNAEVNAILKNLYPNRAPEVSTLSPRGLSIVMSDLYIAELSTLVRNNAIVNAANRNDFPRALVIEVKDQETVDYIMKMPGVSPVDTKCLDYNLDQKGPLSAFDLSYLDDKLSKL